MLAFRWAMKHVQLFPTASQSHADASQSDNFADKNSPSAPPIAPAQPRVDVDRGEKESKGVGLRPTESNVEAQRRESKEVLLRAFHARTEREKLDHSVAACHQKSKSSSQDIASANVRVSHSLAQPGDLELVQEWLCELKGLPQDSRLRFLNEAIDVRSFLE